jgi:hypothetical protein
MSDLAGRNVDVVVLKIPINESGHTALNARYVEQRSLSNQGRLRLSSRYCLSKMARDNESLWRTLGESSP